MQTFLPYPDVCMSLKTLDYKRLGKQRLEARQILKTLYIGSRWQNHPAVKMWKNYENYLSYYYNCCIDEWVFRGYKNTMIKVVLPTKINSPLWLGNEKFHSSHRANLLRKNLVYYSKFNWDEKPAQGYFWPTKEGY